MADDNTEQQTKKRKSKGATSYSNMTQTQAEKRLGFRFQSLRENAISVDDMLANAKYRLEGEAVLKTKEKVYERIVEYLGVEGYPTEAEQDFKEANINHLVFAIISPILSDFKRITGRGNIKLRCEKEIISTDGETGGTEEFVMVDQISVKEEKFIFVVEAKRSSLGQAVKQCLLATEDMRDQNHNGGEVYGFVTTGESWQMIRYDGTSFELTDKIDALFARMGQDKEKWMDSFRLGGSDKDILQCCAAG